MILFDKSIEWVITYAYYYMVFCKSWCCLEQVCPATGMFISYNNRDI